jgi:phospholipase C
MQQAFFPGASYDWRLDVLCCTRGGAPKPASDLAFSYLPRAEIQPYWDVVPSTQNSDHAFPMLARFGNAVLNGTTGPSWVAAIVNGIGQSRYWRDTVVLVLWDDWGGWYGHVPPPQVVPDPMRLYMS